MNGTAIPLLESRLRLVSYLFVTFDMSVSTVPILPTPLMPPTLIAYRPISGLGPTPTMAPLLVGPIMTWLVRSS